MATFLKVLVTEEGLSTYALSMLASFECCELRLFGLTNIPLLFAVSPKVVELTDERLAVKIPLNYITRNHLGSMYFGVLAMGADCACGLLAMHHIQASGKKVSLIFKDFKAELTKRAEEDVIFVCEEGAELKALVQKAIETGERHHQTIAAQALSSSTQEVVAQFQLTISLKRR